MLRRALVLALASLAALPALAHAVTTATTTYASVGQYTFTVPTGVTSLTATVTGAGGGSISDGNCVTNSSGGKGASVSGTLAVNPGTQLALTVAGRGRGRDSSFCGGSSAGGFGGGGDGAGMGGGGGASVIAFPAASAFTGLLFVAGGGGGAGWATDGGDAGAAGPGSFGGGAGSATSGGTSGAGGSGASPGSAGSFGLGGNGGNGASGGFSTGGGGGGSGYYGGGGGGGGAIWNPLAQPSGGGGGGSSFVTLAATGVPGPTVAGSLADGSITITYAAPTADVTGGPLAFGTVPQGSASPEQTITVTNNGNAPLTVSAIAVSGTGAGDYLVNDRCTSAVAVTANCKIGVRFAPQAGSSGGVASSASLTITTTAPSAPSAVSLSGTGGQLPAGTNGTNGTNGTAGTNGTNGAAGTNGTNGAKGDAGAKGDPGAKGDAGAKGEAGAKGDTGPAGPSLLAICRPVRGGHADCVIRPWNGQVAARGAGRAVLRKGARVVARGRVDRRGVLRLRRPGSVPPGRYWLVTFRRRGAVRYVDAHRVTIRRS